MSKDILTTPASRCVYCKMIKGVQTGSPEQIKCNHYFQDNQSMINDTLKEIGETGFRATFIHEFCNNHNMKIRWLRGVFIDEDEKLNTVLDYLQKADDTISYLKSEIANLSTNIDKE